MSAALIDNLNHLARVVQSNSKEKKYETIQHEKIDNFLQKFDNTLVKLNSVISDFPPNCLMTASYVTGENEINFFLFFIRTLIVRILNQAEEIDQFITGNQHLTEELKELKELLNQENSICYEFHEGNDPISLPKIATNLGDLKNFDDVCSNPNYLNHYFARHADFLSSVVVVLWKDLIPGPAFCFDGKPVLYVHQSFSEPGEFSSWNKDPPHPSNNREYSESEINAAKSVRQVISQYQSDLFINHSNLVAIRSSESPEGICIEFVVVAKHFIPMTEKKLPDEIEGIRTKVTSGWVGFTGRKEQRMMRPILPGAGIGCDTQLILNVSDEDYNPPALGTLGGYYHRNGTVYGVTCAHCVLDKTGKAFHPAGSEVYQPCAMGKIVDAAAGTDLLRGYQSLKRTKTDRQAMQWLIKEIEINPEIRPEDFCGTFVNAKLGPTTNGTVVDVALIQMNKEINLQCNHSAGIPNSPSLLLGDNGTQILDVNDFSNSSFKIYGRGAYSAGTMISILDPRYPEIFIRSVDSNEGGLVFDSIHSAVEMYWQTGDSGTWCWTEEGLLVGMGFAYAIIGGIKYCCILPMSDVVEAIKELLPAENV